MKKPELINDNAPEFFENVAATIKQTAPEALTEKSQTLFS